jgi:hypothetical protein
VRSRLRARESLKRNSAILQAGREWGGKMKGMETMAVVRQIRVTRSSDKLVRTEARRGVAG